jgi:hypothetical protein
MKKQMCLIECRPKNPAAFRQVLIPAHRRAFVPQAQLEISQTRRVWSASQMKSILKG